jgi:hypothetical protein
MKGVVPVSYREMALLRDYSKKTGVPIDRCVSEALADWLANVAPVNLELSDLPPLNVQPGKWGIRLVTSQKAVSITRPFGDQSIAQTLRADREVNGSCTCRLPLFGYPISTFLRRTNKAFLGELWPDSG